MWIASAAASRSAAHFTPGRRPMRSTGPETEIAATTPPPASLMGAEMEAAVVIATVPEPWMKRIAVEITRGRMMIGMAVCERLSGICDVFML